MIATPNRRAQLSFWFSCAALILQLATVAMMGHIYYRYRMTVAAFNEVFPKREAPLRRPTFQPTAAANVVTPPAVHAGDVLKLDAIETKAVESNDSWTRHSWVATITNRTNEETRFRLRVEWMDESGFVVAVAETAFSRIGPLQTDTLRGIELIDHQPAAMIRSVRAKARLE